MPVRLASVVVGGRPDPWLALGFTVDGRGVMAFENGSIELDTDASGMVALRVERTGATDPASDLDGVLLTSGTCVPAAAHPNGCFQLDHVVIVTPSIERTSAAIEATLGLAQRRVRETETVRQAFHRFDDRGCIVELVESARADRAALWGLVVNTADLHGFVAQCDPDVLGELKPAVQPGRSIVTVRPSAGLGVAVAVMSV